MNERGLANLIATVLIAAVTIVLSSNYIVTTQNFVSDILPSQDIPIGKAALKESKLEIVNPTTVPIPIDTLVVTINNNNVEIHEETPDKIWSPSEKISFDIPPQSNFFTLDIYYGGKRIYHAVVLRSLSSNKDKEFPTLYININKSSKTLHISSTDDIALCSYKVTLGFPEGEMVQESGMLFPENELEEVYAKYIEFEKTGDSSQLSSLTTFEKDIPLNNEYIRANYIIVSVTDFTGKTSSRVVYVVNNPPNVNIITPQEGAIIWTTSDNASVLISATAADDFEVSSVEMFITSINGSVYKTWSPNTTIFTISEYITLSPANYSVTIRALDLARKSASDYVNFIVKRDFPPTVQIIDPSDGSTFQSLDSTYTLDVTVTAEDDRELKSLTTYFDDSVHSTIAISGKSYSYTFSVDVPTDGKEHTITVEVRDISDQTSSDSIKVTVLPQDAPPTVELYIEEV